MFQNISLLYIFGPAVILIIIIRIIYTIKAGPYKNEFEQSVSNFKINLILISVLLILLYLSLPSIPPLSTSYPTDINSVNTNEKVLAYLQKYNQAIVRTIEVLMWSLFIMVWWFLSSIFYLIKAYKNYTTHQPYK